MTYLNIFPILTTPNANVIFPTIENISRNTLFTIFILLITSTTASAQSQITGKVVDKDSKKPLVGANVFLENTLRGTITDDQGRFELEDIDQGVFTLVVSMVGYERETMTVTVKSPSQASDSSHVYQVALASDPVEMKGVTVEANRSEWLDHLNDFRDLFLGETQLAEACEFVNPEVLSFETKGDTLVARAERPLRIRNNALGYEITYHLPRYKFFQDTWTRYGTAEFDTIRAESDSQRVEWEQTRERVYRGSFYHFIDALQARTLEQEGFQVSVVPTYRLQQGEVRERNLSREISNEDKIFSSLKPGVGLLKAPGSSDGQKGLVVQYSKKRDFLPSDRGASPQISTVRFIGGNKALVNTKTGYSMRFRSRYFEVGGFWESYLTAATALPASYSPQE